MRTSIATYHGQPSNLMKNGHLQCEAKANSTGERCKKPAEPGYNVCRLHGGKTPRGMASPHWKGKGISMALPKRMLQRFQEAMEDDELLSTRSGIALLAARLDDLLKRVDTGESGQLWDRLKASKRELMSAHRRKDKEAESEALNAMLATIDAGHSDYAAWREIGSVLQQYRKLSESEQKRLTALDQMVKVEDMNLFVYKIMDSLRTHVTDRAILQAITSDLNAVLYIEASHEQK